MKTENPQAQSMLADFEGWLQRKQQQRESLNHFDREIYSICVAHINRLRMPDVNPPRVNSEIFGKYGTGKLSTRKELVEWLNALALHLHIAGDPSKLGPGGLPMFYLCTEESFGQPLQQSVRAASA